MGENDLSRHRILPPTDEDRIGFEAARQRARKAWKRLAKLPSRERISVVEQEPGLQSWALTELLCDESVRASADGRAGEALDQARLAYQIAALVPEDPSWRARLQGYACAHLANALRAEGHLREAEEGFHDAEKLWLEGAVSHPGPLDNGRALRLEALLRRAQRRLPDALALLDRALTICHDKEKPLILIQTGSFLAESGHAEKAVRSLLRAGSHLDRRKAPRLRLDLLFNLTVSLAQAGRHTEAQPLLAELRPLTADHGTDLDRVRLRWLEARSAAALGRPDAVAALEEAHAALVAHSLAHEAVLAALELAALHAAQGRPQAVQELARRIAGIASSAEAGGIPREAQATIKLFCRLAEKDALAPEQTRRFGDDYLRTRGDPNLRPEPWPGE